MMNAQDIHTKTITDYVEEARLKKLTSAQVLGHVSARLSNPPYTRDEGAMAHFCVFCVPIHRASASVYAGHHIKAGAWIPPGGHIDLGESPAEAVIREAREELGYNVDPAQIEFYSVSYGDIPNRPRCIQHLDLWFTINMNEMIKFEYEKREFKDAAWLPIDELIMRESLDPVRTVLKHLQRDLLDKKILSKI